ncbi:hypothetical protein K2224_32175 (plasmid) [Streptomyces sp. BHT-5-2]|uniref:hypothetical protein n=1 Tax=Streptomyces sp. BHT-5-2 TaxID=2866715 RepID=UPI001C8E45A5|nr:hypothetical protein K2224_32175 [Streptomyces sp. BHT-5-2]
MACRPATLGLRYTMDAVPLDPSCVRGSHRRVPDSSAGGPLVLCSDPDWRPHPASEGAVRAVDFPDLLPRPQSLRD